MAVSGEPGAVKGQGSIVSGLVGSVAPEIALPEAATGAVVRLSEFRGADVALVFFRGTWCPFCREQMRLLAGSQERLEQAGIRLVGVVCQSQGSVSRYLAENPLPFPLLVDESRQAARRYGVHYWLSPEGFNLARPSLFIIDKSGTVLFEYIGKNMSDLPVSSLLDTFIRFLSPSADGNST